MPDRDPAPDVAAAVAEARRLAGRLDPRLKYHNARHTFDEVVPAAERLAQAAGLNERDRKRLLVAAAYHDLGFLLLPGPNDPGAPDTLDDARGTGHEAVSVQLMRSALAGLDFGEEAVDAIEGMILATRLPQRPRNLPERLMADADLALLGSPAFPARNEHLRLERSLLGAPLTREAWLRLQLRFLLSHRYTSTAGERLFGPGRRRNAQVVRAYLARQHAGSPAREPLAAIPRRC